MTKASGTGHGSKLLFFTFNESLWNSLSCAPCFKIPTVTAYSKVLKKYIPFLRNKFLNMDSKHIKVDKNQQIEKKKKSKK